jgi:hypothetical protein
MKIDPVEYGPPLEALPPDPDAGAPARGVAVARDAAPGLDLERELEQDARRDEDPAAMLREAVGDLDAGRPESAWRRIRRALLEAPAAPDAYPLLMRAALQQRKADLAHLVALRAEQAGVKGAEIAYLRGRAYQAQGQEALARAEWIRAAEAGHGAARRALLHVEFANRNWPGVEVHATELVQRHPQDAVPRLALGVAQRHAGRADDALEDYALAEKLAGGKLAEVHFARAILLARVKADCDAATSELRRYELLAGPDALGDSVAVLQRDCARSRAAAARVVPATAPAASGSAAAASGADARPTTRPVAGAPVRSARP